MAKSNLVIVESPAKAKTIGKYLGPDYKVLASMGHVRDLPKSKMGVDWNTTTLNPTTSPSRARKRPLPSCKRRLTRAKKSTSPPTRTGRARPFPGT